MIQINFSNNNVSNNKWFTLNIYRINRKICLFIHSFKKVTLKSAHSASGQLLVLDDSFQ